MQRWVRALAWAQDKGLVAGGKRAVLWGRSRVETPPYRLRCKAVLRFYFGRLYIKGPLLFYSTLVLLKFSGCPVETNGIASMCRHLHL